MAPFRLELADANGLARRDPAGSYPRFRASPRDGRIGHPTDGILAGTRSHLERTTVRRLRPETVYLVYSTGEGFFFHLMSVLFSVFLIVELELGPFQLLLLGTVLELTYLLFEVPTGSSPTP